MTLEDLAKLDFEAQQALDDWAEDVEYFAPGAGSGTTVRGTFEETTAEQNESRGQELRRQGTLRISLDESVDVRGSWDINGARWQTLSIAAEADCRMLKLQRVEPETRGQAGDGLR